MIMASRILLFGADGQIGHELGRCLCLAGDVIPMLRKDADFSEPGQLTDLVRAHAPQLIVNAAAYTQVEGAESEPALAQRINCDAVEVLAKQASRLDIPLIHFSTDYVFSGKQKRPYREEDATGPLNAYGRSKLAGEEAIRQSGARHLIIRTAWVYSVRRHNFVGTILRLAQREPELRIVDDQIGVPTWALLPAQGVSAILARHPLAHGGWPENLSGKYHLTPLGSTSWYGFAEEIRCLLKQNYPGRVWPPVVPIRTAEFGTSAIRPAYSVLDSSKFANTFSVELPAWQALLHRMMQELSYAPLGRMMQGDSAGEQCL